MTEAEFAVEHMKIEREERKRYREMMIKEIMELTDCWTREQLVNKSTRALEAIYDNC